MGGTMSTKVNINAQAIFINKDKFKINESYSYNDICKLSGMKKTSGEARIKQMNIFKEIFNTKEWSKGRSKMYKIISINDLSDEQAMKLIADNRGKNPNSHASIYSKEIGATLLYKILQNAFEEDSSILQDDEDTIIMLSSRHDIAVDCGIRHRHNFMNYKKSPNFFCNKNDIDANIAAYAFPHISNKSYSAVNTMISYLKNNDLALISEVMEIDIVDMTDDEGYIIGEEDTDIIERNIANRKFERIIADEETRKDITLQRMKIAKDMGYKNISTLYNNASQETINELHEKLNKYTAKKFGIFGNYPRVEIRSSISLIEKHLSKFEQITLEEFMEEGFNTFNKSLIDKFKSDIRCFDSAEERETRFNRIKYKEDKKTKKVKEYKELYLNTIMKDEVFMDNVSKLIENVCNTNAEITTSIAEDIKLEGDQKEEYEVFRDNGEHFRVTVENNKYTSSSIDEEEDELLKEILEL